MSRPWRQGRFVATGDPASTARGSLTLSVIREQLADVMASRIADDAQLHYLDGHLLYGPDDAADHPLPDNLHPDADTHQMIGERFARLTLTGQHGPFAARPAR
jgi:hypothetical protein